MCFLWPTNAAPQATEGGGTDVHLRKCVEIAHLLVARLAASESKEGNNTTSAVTPSSGAGGNSDGRIEDPAQGRVGRRVATPGAKGGGAGVRPRDQKR